MNKETHLEIKEDRGQELEMIESLIRKQASHNEPIRILEAGCGSHWPFRLEEIQYTLTGVDVDRVALEIRKNTLSDLHEAIEADLCSVDLGADRFDVIYCHFVLEHIKRADVVMKNFVKWIKPDGIIIIKIPDPYSVSGYISRITPYWFHVFYYRFIRGNKNSGKPGYFPYPTYYHSIVSRRGMRDFCNDKSNGVVLVAEYGDDYFRPRRGAMKTLLPVFTRVINIISIGSLSDKHTNLLYIIRKTKEPVLFSVDN
jgi:SAM-dependent methyltransferase